MATIEELARDFLAQRRIAVAGVSRDPRQTANLIYRHLRETGHEVVPVNPGAREVEGAPCYPDLRSVPGPVDGVMVVTRPEAAPGLVRECAALGIPRVWMHRAFGAGSLSAEAVRIGREQGMRVIPGACPLMFGRGADPFHRCLGWFMGRRKQAD